MIEGELYWKPLTEKGEALTKAVAELLNDENERVRIEAPEMFRVLGKRKPEFVRPYLEKLDYMATHDEVSVVRIHAKGAIKATLSKSKVIKEPDAKTQSR